MTCVTCCGPAVQTCSMSDASAKLNHRRFRALLKKFRRKRIRQNAAKERDRLLEGEQQPQEEEGKEEEEEEDERERQRQHELWLEREAEAQRQFAARRLEQEQEQKQEQEEQEEQQQQQQQLSKEDSLKQVLAQLPQASTSVGGRGQSWHNPPAPNSYRPQEPCPFFLKTGACRFADSCSRAHPVPAASRTLLLRGLYGHVSLEPLAGGGGDEALETDEGELRAHFEHFFWDLLGELRRAGTVRQLRVCRNLEPHLRGNVYVQYHSVEEAQRARTLLNGRWYAGRPVSCEFSPVERWKTAVCGLFFRGACPKGRSCNFLHVFRNPQDECWHEGGTRSPPAPVRPRRSRRSPPEEHRRKRSRRRSRSGSRRHRSRSSSRSRHSKKPTSRRRSTSRHR